jgi:hypothetical protein
MKLGFWKKETTQVAYILDGNSGLGFGSPAGLTFDGCGFGFTFSPVGLSKPNSSIFGCVF